MSAILSPNIRVNVGPSGPRSRPASPVRGAQLSFFVHAQQRVRAQRTCAYQRGGPGSWGALGPRAPPGPAGRRVGIGDQRGIAESITRKFGSWHVLHDHCPVMTGHLRPAPCASAPGQPAKGQISADLLMPNHQGGTRHHQGGTRPPASVGTAAWRSAPWRLTASGTSP